MRYIVHCAGTDYRKRTVVGYSVLTRGIRYRIAVKIERDSIVFRNGNRLGHIGIQHDRGLGRTGCGNGGGNARVRRIADHRDYFIESFGSAVFVSYLDIALFVQIERRAFREIILRKHAVELAARDESGHIFGLDISFIRAAEKIGCDIVIARFVQQIFFINSCGTDESSVRNSDFDRLIGRMLRYCDRSTVNGRTFARLIRGRKFGTRSNYLTVFDIEFTRADLDTARAGDLGRAGNIKYAYLRLIDAGSCRPALDSTVFNIDHRAAIMLIFAVGAVARNTERSAGNGAVAEIKRIITARITDSVCRSVCHHIAEEYDAGACFGRKFAASYRYVAGIAVDGDLGARHAGFRRSSDAERRIRDLEAIYTVSAYDARRMLCIRNSEVDLKAINNDVHCGRF